MPKEIPVEIETHGLTGDIAKSIMTPGYTAKGVIQIMFYTFYALFATLLFMLFMTGGNPHVIALLLLAICLFVTIKWFIGELEHAKMEEERNKKE
ncbi:hypothetical protein G6F56_013736 [Rhizopus delemar]|nr:hypothetical protein G6F56_013736 [Rhizopus delemar]